MSPITHFLMGWAVAHSAPSLDKRERAMVTWAGVVPDVDGLGIIADALTRNSSHSLNWWGDYHHIPLEMFSSKADAIFVDALRTRFPFKIKTTEVKL